MPKKLILSLGALYLLLAVLFSALGAALWMDMDAAERQTVLALLEHRYPLAVAVILAAWGVLGALAHALYRAYVTAPLSLRDDARVIVSANPQRRLVPRGAPEIRRLAETINALADQRQALAQDVEARVRAAAASLEEEKNRLAALMSELAQSVVVCNLDGQVLLYNERARRQFEALHDPDAAAGAIGLGRSIFAVLDRNLVAHAVDTLQHLLQRGESHPGFNFVTTTGGGQLLRVQMAAVRAGREGGGDEAAIGGYVLVLEDVTRAVEAEIHRDYLLGSLTEESRAALANVRAAVENLLDYPDMAAADRDRFIGVVAEEVRRMGARLDRTVHEYADALKARWPLEDMPGADLIAAARRRIEARLGLPAQTAEVDERLWLRVDSFSLIQALSYLAQRLRDELGVREVRFRLGAEGRLARLDLMWSGTAVSAETLHAWEVDPMDAGGEMSPLTLRDVAERHGGELWFQIDKAAHQAFFRLLIPVAATPPAAAQAHRGAGASRPEYYDFDLFKARDRSCATDDSPLGALTYTVFDTETTGLDPAAGDEIIQIGAVRIVNGRLLRGEAFDRLVDPRRALAPASARVHGITEDMLAGQPTIETVLPAFYRYCEDTVLVAHNAAFDLRFLQLKEAATDIAFRQPVLDTLLLSAVIHPHEECHALEAIAERLGLSVVGRHTALGDAIVTGEAFLRMIPLLADMGIRTLRQAREASERTYYARLRY